MSFSTKRVDWILDPKQAGLTGDELPTKDDFMIVWKKLPNAQRAFVSAGIQCESLAEWIEKVPGLTYTKIYKLLDSGTLVMRAMVIGRMMSMPSDVAKATYLEVLLKNEKSRKHHRGEIARVITTDREHLQELAKAIMTDGDGKRAVLKELIAYGMQTKVLEPVKISEATGEIIAPAIYTIADPRIALISLQEMNKMDHEYAEAKTSTSSIESQAERIARLRKTPLNNKDLLQRVNYASEKQAKVLNGVAKEITDRDCKPLDIKV